MPYKIGQEVVVSAGPSGKDYTRGKVKRITPTGRIVVEVWNHQVQFTPDGFKIGSGIYAVKLHELTPQLSLVLRRQELLSIVQRVKWQDVSLATLEAVAAALE